MFGTCNVKSDYRMTLINQNQLHTNHFTTSMIYMFLIFNHKDNFHYKKLLSAFSQELAKQLILHLHTKAMQTVGGWKMV